MTTRPIPHRVLHRFEKPGGRWAQIIEMHQGRSIGWQVVVDGNVWDGRFYHDGRTDLYASETPDKCLL
jgi:hypothetical protein